MSENKNQGYNFEWYHKQIVDNHFSDCYKICFITVGKAEMKLNGKVINAQKNHVFLMTPKDEYCISPMEGTRYVAVIFYVEPVEMGNLCQMLGKPISSYNFEGKKYRLVHDITFNFLLERIRRINYLKHASQDPISLNMTIKGIIVDILVHFNNSLDTSFQSYPEWFANLLFKVNSPEFLTKSASDIYKISNYSPASIIKYFKKFTGDTIVEYMKKLRMRHACELLLDVTLNTSIISSTLGYESLSHFNRVFKQTFGMTPSEYREEKANLRKHL